MQDALNLIKGILDFIIENKEALGKIAIFFGIIGIFTYLHKG